MAIPKQLQDLLDKMTEQLREAILSSVSEIKSRARMAALVSAIEKGRVDDVLKVLNLSDEFFEPIDDAIRASYILGGREAMQALTAKFQKADRLSLFFSGRNPSAEAWMRSVSSRLIVEISSSTREAVRGILTNGLAEGRNPRTVAVALMGRLEGRVRVGGVIGLNSHLVGYLENARRELQSGDASQLRSYLARQLRDHRYDALVEGAIASGRRLRADKIDEMLSHYSDRLLRFRSETIARTESLSMLNASRHEAAQQVIGAGVAQEEDVSRRWRAAGADGRTRDTHLDMDDQVVSGLRDPFVSSSGARLMHPGDTSLGAPAEEVINCRCYEEIFIDYVAAQARREKSGV